MDAQTSLIRAIEKSGCSQAEFLRNDVGLDSNLLVSSQIKRTETARDAKNANEDDTPLHAAVILGNLEMARTLLDHSADVNSQNWLDLTPLHIAAAIGQVDMVELLISRGASANVSSSNVLLARYVAAEDALQTRPDLLRERTNYDSRFKKNYPIHFAATFGHVKVVEILLDHSERLGTSDECDIVMEEFIKRTSLQRAILFLQPDVVDLLLKRGAAPFDNVQFKLHFNTDLHCFLPTPLSKMQVHVSRRLRVFDVLFTSGQFNTNTLNSGFETQLHEISRDCQCDYLKRCQKLSEKCEIIHFGDTIMKKLLENGANVNQTNRWGETALMIAAKHGCDHFIRILLDWAKKSGIKLLLDMRDQLGQTALLKATINRQVHVVKLLVENGASVSVPDIRGFTALHAAKYGEGNWFTSDYFYLRKLADGRFHENFNKIFAFAGYSGNKIQKSVAEREIEKIFLASGVANEASVDFAGKKPRDLAEDQSETLTSQTPASGNRVEDILPMSSNQSIGFEEIHIDDWGRTPLHRLCIEFCGPHGPRADNKIITKRMKPTRASQLWKEKIESSAPIRDIQGRTALHYAAMHTKGQTSYIEILLNIGININAVDKYGRTALHYASGDKVYTWLVKHGADEQVRDNRGHTPKYLKELEEMNIKLNAGAFAFKWKLAHIYEKPIDESQIWQIYIDLNNLQRFRTRLNIVAKELEGFMERLASAIGERDYRFACDAKLVGSAADGTKIDIPGDFDFDLTLTELSKRCEIHPSPVAPNGFVHLKRKGYGSEHILYRRKDDFDAFFNEEQLLLVNEVNCRFTILLAQVLQDPYFWRNEETFESRNFMTMDKTDNSLTGLHKSIVLQMIHPLKDEYGDLYFDDLHLDIVPCIHVDNWWPDEALDNVKEEVKFVGCNLVFDSPFRSFPWIPFAETYVRISFALVESHIIKNSHIFLKAAFINARYMCCRTLALRKYLYKRGHRDYVLKSSFLYCIEAFDFQRIGAEPTQISLALAKELNYFIDRILFCFAEFCYQGFLPCYFMPSFSLPTDLHLKSGHIEYFLYHHCDDSERSLDHSVIQPLFERFGRDAFMTKLRDRD